ncbi:MAG: type III pantothenate kinase [Rhodospirillales bacterium]|jgi:type III pantothenate kinase|nr:type III pantothenate kinase [Rhodospirillales bacterium]
MLLAIDSGNTNIVFAVFDDAGKLRGEWRAATNVNRTADELWVWLTHLMQLAELNRTDIDKAIVATVVPATLFNLKTLCRKYFDADPLVIGEPDCELGIEILLDHPEEVGADRLVNAVAAREIYGTPLIVIDFGTATTFDVIDQGGNYCGGVIAPGVNLSLEALHRAAAKLPRIAVARPEKVIGKSTVPAMQSGIFWGYLSMIEGLIGRIRKEFLEQNGADAEMEVIATGGLAPLFADASPMIRCADVDLTIKGLLSIDARNMKS